MGIENGYQHLEKEENYIHCFLSFLQLVFLKWNLFLFQVFGIFFQGNGTWEIN